MSLDDELEKIKQKMLNNLINKSTETNSIWKKGYVVDLNEMTFAKSLNETSIPIIVDFWAEWCSPCKIMSPIFQSLAKKYAGKVGFAKLNVDMNQRIAAKYGVMSIPNFIIFKSGKRVDQILGAVGEAGLESLIRKHLL